MRLELSVECTIQKLWAADNFKSDYYLPLSVSFANLTSLNMIDQDPLLCFLVTFFSSSLCLTAVFTRLCPVCLSLGLSAYITHSGNAFIRRPTGWRRLYLIYSHEIRRGSRFLRNSFRTANMCQSRCMDKWDPHRMATLATKLPLPTLNVDCSTIFRNRKTKSATSDRIGVGSSRSSHTLFSPFLGSTASDLHQMRDPVIETQR